MKCEDCRYFEDDIGYCEVLPGRPIDREPDEWGCGRYVPLVKSCETCRLTYRPAPRGERLICTHGLHAWEIPPRDESARDVTDFEVTHCCYWEGE